MGRESPLHTTLHVAASLPRVPECALKCPRCSSCGSPLPGESSCPQATHHGQELVSQRLMCCGDLDARACCANPKSSQVSGKLCRDSRPLPARLSPLSLCTRRLAPRRSRRSHSPRITFIKNGALCLPHESLRRINLLFLFFFPNKECIICNLIVHCFGE